MKKILTAIIDPEREEASPILSWVWLGGLFLLGLILWGYFLNFGTIPFDFHDWAEVNAPRIAFLKDAVTTAQLPLHMPDASALRGVTDRFMALPDVILSPQILLLKWLSVGDFILIHTWLLFAAGFCGLLALKNRFGLSLYSFTWIFFLFNFNGHILSHYAVGHITWGGYFLFPWFILLVFQLLHGERSWRWAGSMAFLLFAIFLQGSFHQFVWLVIFLAILALTRLRTLLPILKAGIFACLLSAVRIIPPALQMGAFDDEFLGGFRTPLQLVKALIRIIPPAESLDSQVTGATLGWWEFDSYIGLAGLLFLAIFGLRWLLTRRKEFGYPALIAPLALLTLFAIRNFYGIVRLTRIPLFSGERVSARFLIVPLAFLILLSALALQDWLRNRRYALPALIFPSVGSLLLLAELWSHIETWKVTAAAKAFPFTYTDLSLKLVSNHPDPVYTNGLLAGLAITSISAVVLVALCVREAKHAG